MFFAKPCERNSFMLVNEVGYVSIEEGTEFFKIIWLSSVIFMIEKLYYL